MMRDVFSVFRHPGERRDPTFAALKLDPGLRRGDAKEESC